MKKIIFTCGLIGGAISTIGYLYSMISGHQVGWDWSMVFGYASMLLAFSLIFVGIRQYRDRHLGGTIKFGKAFLVGLYITLVASSVYVLVWLFYYYNFAPDFMEEYSTHYLEKMRAAGASAAEIEAATKEMASFGEMYKNPLFNALITYTEILPVGLLVSLVAAAILKRKTARVEPTGVIN